MNLLINIQRHVLMILAAAMLLIPLYGLSAENEKPYKGYTGSVHQVGFIGGVFNTLNPNYSATQSPKNFRDLGLGATYTLHDYVTRQFTFDFMTSVTVITAKYLDISDFNDNHSQKIIWPMDCRFLLGPSEDFQAYICTGLQWCLFEKSIGDYDILTCKPPRKAVHQLSGNTGIGMNFFGPQNYMFHLNVGVKLHYPICQTDSHASYNGVTDMTLDRGCAMTTCGITVDIDRKKKACVMLNCEYPLEKLESQYGKLSFFNRFHTISLGIIFHIGGSR